MLALWQRDDEWPLGPNLLSHAEPQSHCGLFLISTLCYLFRHHLEANDLQFVKIVVQPCPPEEDIIYPEVAKLLGNKEICHNGTYCFMSTDSVPNLKSGADELSVTHVGEPLTKWYIYLAKYALSKLCEAGRLDDHRSKLILERFDIAW